MQETERTVIPPQSGHAFRLAKGQQLRITDPKGAQVADLWAFSTDGNLDWLSASQTRDIIERLFPTVGESFYGMSGEKLLTLVEDASPGPHDMLFPACNPALYRRAGFEDHPSCAANLHKALTEAGVSFPFTPDPVDFFQNSLPAADGTLVVAASINPPGAYVRLRAERDLLVIVTACSVDHHPTNGDACTEIEVEVLAAED
ncbi:MULTISPECIES: DUF1989 domain-containing protein [Phyllobacteriaceae]|uniref:Urea carboxylase-associated family protein n=1 Tax=Ollibium composti TaxID=2675109 RepID=A0ABY2QCC6_9HYPH|nr:MULTISPECIES: urea carboxylase-associated family protein [Mesorhizobium]QDB99858.1 urea carboxylase-associated family protein [Mesorhizobium sp. 8]THF59760.1 urea carboxylase-associated family protein [Mesorhizobium composti]